jgi:hypothetical protein
MRRKWEFNIEILKSDFPENVAINFENSPNYCMIAKYLKKK